YLPVKARSVPFFRVTSNCSGLSACFHSWSVFTTFSTITVPFLLPESVNSTKVTKRGLSLLREAPAPGGAAAAIRLRANALPIAKAAVRNPLRLKFLSLRPCRVRSASECKLHPLFVPLFALRLTLQEMDSKCIWLQEVCHRQARGIGVGKAPSSQAFSIGAGAGELAPLTGYTRLRSGSQER